MLTCGAAAATVADDHPAPSPIRVLGAPGAGANRDLVTIVSSLLRSADNGGRRRRGLFVLALALALDAHRTLSACEAELVFPALFGHELFADVLGAVHGDLLAPVMRVLEGDVGSVAATSIDLVRVLQQEGLRAPFLSAFDQRDVALAAGLDAAAASAARPLLALFEVRSEPALIIDFVRQLVDKVPVASLVALYERLVASGLRLEANLALRSYVAAVARPGQQVAFGRVRSIDGVGCGRRSGPVSGRGRIPRPRP